VWTDTHWQRDTSGQIWRLAKQTIKDMAKHLPTDDKAAIALLGHIKSSLSTARQKAMVESAQNEPGIPVDPTAFDMHPWLLNCANGTLDLSTDTLLPHTREHLLTQYIPVDYDPSAYSELWHTFLHRILDDNDELIAFVQRAVGYALTGVIREHVLIILWGSGRNGKSTLLMTILKLLGPYGLKAVSELLMASAYDRHLTERADLYQKRLVIVSETEQGRRLAESFTKDATGGENIRARRMHENTWEFAPTHKLLMATNHKPVIHGTDDAIWERMKLVPFTVTIPFEERDTSLLEKLGAELSGILTWAVLGCQQWRQYGLGEPEEVTSATQKYKDESDPLGQFLADCCKAEKGATTETSKLYTAYLDWCAGQENMLPMKMRDWGMTERGFERDRGTANAHVRRGIRLINGLKAYGQGTPQAQPAGDPSDPS
jgi:putative DNA primase/helicase